MCDIKTNLCGKQYESIAFQSKVSILQTLA